jgi:hypothetical protein
MSNGLPVTRELTGPKPLTPLRYPASVRRTSTLVVTWPDGADAPGLFDGRCRDILTLDPDSEPTVLARGSITARVTLDRIIHGLSTDPVLPALDGLEGLSAARGLRGELRARIEQEMRDGTPTYQLLDDLAPVSLVANTAFSAWPEKAPSWYGNHRRERVANRPPEGICVGIRPGSSGMRRDGSPPTPIQMAIVPPLANGADPFGWHEFYSPADVSMYRARRIDAWLDGGTIVVDSAFQDSVLLPEGSRKAVHEYALKLIADAESLILKSIEAEPHVLPRMECPQAPENLKVLIGAPMEALRAEVLVHLRGTAGCTHLNDAIRALADVPKLVRRALGSSRYGEGRRAPCIRPATEAAS